MKIGVIKEIKNNESRVGMTPDNVCDYIKNGHTVMVQKDAGILSGFTNKMYEEAGAIIEEDVAKVWKNEMIVKVKEPLEEEYDFFYEGMILFTYLHLAAEPKLTKALIEKKVTSIAYETVQIEKETPLLRPMSEVAGRRSITIGAHFLEKINGGKGIVIGGTPGVKPANVTIVGGGIAGINAAQMAIGLGAHVTLIELDENKIRYIKETYKNEITVLKSNYSNIYNSVVNSDLVVSTVLIPGAKAPKLVTKEMVENMEEGSVIVDISIDQGGSVETVNKITTHDDPVYKVHGVIHYSVANMPGAVPKTSTIALTNATTPYGVLLANKKLEALEMRKELKLGLNTLDGQIINEAVKATYEK